MYPVFSSSSFGVPQAETYSQALSMKPAEYLDDSDYLEDVVYEDRPGSVSFNANPSAAQIMNARTTPYVENLERGSFTELDLMPIRCFGCGKVMRQQAIETSLASGKSLAKTLDDLNYRRICCREQIRSQPSVSKQLKRIEEQSKIARALSLQSLQMEATSELPSTRPISNLIIQDELIPGQEMTSLVPEGTSIEDENPLEEMDTFSYLQSQIVSPDVDF